MKLVNKLLGIVAILVLLVGSVTAGNIEDPKADISFSFRHGISLNSISGEIDADTLDGKTVEDLTYDDSKVLKKITKVNNKVKSNDEELEYLFDNEDAYLSDRKGTSRKTVERMISVVQDWVRSVFATKEYVESLEKRILALENPDLNDQEMALLYHKNGFEANYGSVSCSNDICIKVIN